MAPTDIAPRSSESNQTATSLNDETFETAAAPDSDVDAAKEESPNPTDDIEDEDSAPERPAPSSIASGNLQGADLPPEPYNFARCSSKIVDQFDCAGQSGDGRLSELLKKFNIDLGQARFETKPEYAEPDQTTTVFITEIEQ